MQESILFHWVMDKSSCVYFEQSVLTIEGTIDTALFARSFNYLVKKYDILRTVFLYDKIKKPLQVVLKKNPGQAVFEDISHLSEAETKKYLEDFKRKDREKGFDLSSDLPIRAALFKTDSNTYQLIWSFHHVVMDGWSSGILFKEFIKEYQRLKKGEASRLESEPVTPYKEYIHWLEQQDREEGLRYWQEYLEGYEQPAVLPGQKKQTETSSPGYRVEEYIFTLDPSLSEKIKKIVSENHVTATTVFQSIWGILLQRYNNTDDVIFGTVVSGRPAELEGIERMVGLFINSIPVRIRLEKHISTFSQLILEVQQKAVRSKSYEYLPLAEIQANSSLKGQLIDHSMGFQNYPIQEEISELSSDNEMGFKLKDFAAYEQTNYDFNCIVSPGRCFVLRFNFNAAVYDRDFVKRVAMHLVEVVTQVTANPGITIQKIESVTREERKQLLEVFNNTGREINPAGKTVHQLFEDQVERTPHFIVLVYEDQYLTYRQLEQKANQMAHYLHDEKSICPGSGVGILLDSSIHLAEAVIGVLKAGGAYVPLNPTLPEKRIKNMIDDTRLEVVISQKKYIGMLNRLQWECESFNTFLCMDSSDIYGEEEVEKHDFMSMTRKLWEYVGETAEDDITGGGWLSSYTGEPFTRKEMDEYGDNILQKLEPLLLKIPRMRVLEIGCASGISMYRIAPRVEFYYGTDLSSVIIEKNRERVKKEGHRNITLAVLAAHEIDTIEKTDFDLIIMNSVIQAFPGHNYLRQVIRKAVHLLGPRGYLFIGDVMDLELKGALIREMMDFKRECFNQGKNVKTKTDFSGELFLSRAFFEDLGKNTAAVEKIEFSTRIHTVKNELTEFRYDVLVTIDKNKSRTGKAKSRGKIKHQQDLGAVEKYSFTRITPPIKKDDPVYVIYTSGSTGIPKGVIVEHGSAANTLLCRKEEYGMNPGVTALQLFSYSFDGFVTAFFSPIISGARVVFPTEENIKDAAALKKIILAHQVTHFISIPALYLALLEELEQKEMQSLKAVTLAGDKLTLDILEQSLQKNKNLEIVNEYGPTEAAVMSTLYRHQERDLQVKIGRPIWNTGIYIMDKSLRLQPVGVTGELCIFGTGMARGYLNNLKLTTETFVTNGQMPIPNERLYRTGDLGRWLPDGNIEYSGRMDFQVKIRGFRVELGEIEGRLVQHPDVEEALVIVKEFKTGDNYLCAYVVGSPGATTGLNPLELREYLSGILPDYMIPSYFVQIDKIPLTVSGKVNRNVLPAPGMQREKKYAAPITADQETLAVIWSELLGIRKDHIGIDTSFFDLGGHSLKATVLVSRIRKALNIEFPLRSVFTGPTIAEMAEFIKKSRKSIYEEISPVEKKEYYPQSSAQKRLFFLDQFETVGTAYHMCSVQDFSGKADRERYEKTFNALIARHESLRTSFLLLDNQPLQRIHPVVESPRCGTNFRIAYHDLTAEDTKRLDAVITNFVRPFDLAQAPLMRAAIVTLSDQEYMLVYDMHHIIGDGTSMQILIEDFLSIYNEEEPVPLNIQYKDFSCWQNNILESGKIKEMESYWLNLYSDAPDIPKLNLPFDYPRPIVFGFKGGSYNFRLGREEAVRFKRAGEEPGTTLFMKLLTAFNILLFKYTGQEEIIVGCDIAGRPHDALHSIIGMFVNELALRNNPCGEKTYPEFLREVRENSIAAFENQDFQFEELVDQLNLERDPSRNPLFDVEFAFQNFEKSPVKEAFKKWAAPLSPKASIGSDVSTVLEDRTAKFDIALDADERGAEILFRLQYCTQLFKPQTIKRMAGHFLNILREIGHNPGIRISSIVMLNDEEKQQILFEFNDTKRDIPEGKCYHQLFEEQAQRTGDRIAAAEHGAGHPAITYSELNKTANRLAHYLYQEESIQPNDRVAVLMDRSIEFLISILGIMKAGGAYVPIETALPEERIKTIIEDAEIRVVIAEEKYIRTLNRLQWDCDTFRTFLLLDSWNAHWEEIDTGELKDDEELWEYIGEVAEDEIAEGGWFNSYTGEPFTKEEMDEYAENTLQKIMPLVDKNQRMRVLEIGCASGLTMYRMAPHVGFYYGTDISAVTIRKNKERIQKEGYDNISVAHLAAHEIDTIEETDFDLIILNSVIQSFHSHNYLRNVLRKAVNLAAEKAYIFVGDVMDQQLKNHLVRELVAFKQASRDKNHKTKTDFSAELFISRAFFEDLVADGDVPGISAVEFSDKIFTIQNELTRFRYDALLHIDKTNRLWGSGAPIPDGCYKSPWPPEAVRNRSKHKHQHDLRTLEKYSTRPVTSAATPDNLAYVIYTSGTTGRPKGVMIHHRGMINHIYAKVNDLSVTSDDFIAQTASASFDISVWQFLTALLKGGQTIIIKREVVLEPLDLLRTLQQGKVTIFETVPSLMKEFIEMVTHEPDNKLNDLRWMIPTGEPLPPSLVRLWYIHYPGIRLVNAYGPTEASDDVTHYVVKEMPEETQQRVPIGKPLQNIHIYILDRHLSLCPIGVRGEICVAGIGVGKGYWKDAKKTRDAFVANPYLEEIRDRDYAILYRTGDIGYFREDGRVECLGRLDEQVKVRGNRIELGEIESWLKRYHAVKEAVVVAKDDKNGDKFLCAYIVPVSSSGDSTEASGLLDTSDIKEYLARELPDYMIPSFFIPMEVIPLTPSGKLDRKSLPEPGVSISGDEEAGIAPTDEIEKKLAAIWSEVLNVSQVSIGIDTDFFEIGGHSLKATGMVSAVHRELKVRIPIAEVFRTPTIRGLADYIRGAKKEEFTAIAPVEEREYHDVSASQKRMYILNIFIEYNMPYVMQLEGDLDRERFEAVFRELVKRHESLRTSFHMMGEEPVQKVHRHVDFNVHEYIPEGTDAGRGTVAVGAPIINDFFRPFDLSRAPLMRVGLIKLSETLHIFLFNIHHIVSDGYTLAILIREFVRLYQGETLPQLKIRYRDFTFWQNRLLKAGEYKKQEAYWLKRFSGEIPLLNMPTDFPRPAVQSFEGSRVHFSIKGETFRAFKSLALKEDASLYMVMLAIYNTLLFRYTGQEDIVIGTITAGRERQELETLPGVFINALAMRNYPTKHKPFEDFLRELKQDTLDAYENQAYPFGDLLEKVVNTDTKRKDISRSPLFDVMLIFQNLDEQFQSMEMETVRFLPYQGNYESIGHAQHDITLWAMEGKEEIQVAVEYCTKLFKKGTMERFAQHFLILLREAVTNPGLKLPDLEMMGEGEKRQVLEQFNDTEISFPEGKTIHGFFEEQVERTPNHIAVVGVIGQHLTYRTYWTYMTYKELDKKSEQLAQLLRARGVKSNTIVAIMMNRTIEMCVGVLAILKAGGAYLPIDPDYPQDRIDYILADSNARILVSGKGEVSNGIEIIELDKINEKSEYLPPHPLHSPTHLSLAYVIYTSGSTGRPKGVMVQHDHFVNAAFAWIKEYRLEEMEVNLLQMAGFSFDVFAGDIARALLTGGELVICPEEVRVDPASLYALIKEYRITLFESTPSLIVPFMDYVYENQLALEHLRLLILGSDICAVEDFRRLVSRFGNRMRIINSYGVTEATIDSSYYEARVESVPQVGNVPIGKPLSNMAFYIKDPVGHLQSVGIPGELHIGGKGVARGYLNNPELTAEKFDQDFLDFQDDQDEKEKADGYHHSSLFTHHSALYRTGDLARWLTDGNMEFLGRIDHQVKIRGFRIELGEIEHQLLNHKDIKEVVVTAGGNENEYLCAYFVPAGEEVLNNDASISGELRRYLSRSLPDYMVPSYFAQLKKIPLTPGGKVDRRLLPVPGFVSDKTYIAPRDSLEKKLAEIWANILSLDVGKIGIDDNFFHLGGHSLKAARVMAEVHKKLNVYVSMEKLFLMSTIRSLAENIRSTVKEVFAPIEVLDQAEFYDLSHAQKRLWTLSQVEEASLTFNMQDLYMVEGELDEKAFEKALDTLVEQHESLRTVFITVNGEPKQKIVSLKQLGFGLKRIDLRNEPNKEAAVRQRVHVELGTLFDLSSGPLLRVQLMQLEEKKVVFLLVIHHIIGDAVSMEVFFSELFLLYDCFKNGKENPIPPLRVHYKDYAAWQNRQLKEKVDAVNQHRDYWLRQLSGHLPVLELPLDNERSEHMVYEGDTAEVHIDKELTQQLKSLGRRYDASLFMILLAAVKILFFRYTGQTDILLGTTIDGREHSDLDHQIGFYINTLALRTRINPGDSFEDIVEKVREVTLSAYEHKIYPFDRLVEELGVRRDITRHPLFDVVVDMINYIGPKAPGVYNNPATPPEIQQSDHSLNFMPFESGYHKSKFDLTVYIFEARDSLNIQFEYKTDLFNQSTMNRMVQRLKMLLTSIVKNPTEMVTRLSVDRPLEYPDIAAAAQEETLVPASYHQERLWFIDQFETDNLYEGGPSYHNIPLIVRISRHASVDRERLEQSIQDVIRRHPALRTRVVTVDNKPYQWIDPDVCFRLDYLELGPAGCDSSSDTVLNQALAEAARPFVPGEEPLIRGQWMEIPGKEFLLLLTLHHIIADKYSLDILLREMLMYYKGQGDQLPPLSYTYADFSQWQQAFPEDLSEALLFYWREKLRGPIQPLELPTDRPRAAVHIFQAEWTTFDIPSPLVQRTRAFCETTNISTDVFLLALFKVLLHRYSNQDEIVVGIPSLNRQQPGMENIFGPLSNLLVLRSHVPGTLTFRQVMTALERTVTDARRYGAMPFDRLVSELNPHKDMSRTALFDVLFQYEEKPRQLPEVGDWEVSIEETNLGWGKYDLNMLIQDKGDFFFGHLVTNACYYDASTLQRWVSHYSVLLESCLNEPDIPIEALPLLTPGEQHQLVKEWNRTACDYPKDKTVHQLIEEQVEKRPDNIAIIGSSFFVDTGYQLFGPGMGTISITYNELNKKSNQLAWVLQQKGVEPDTIVGMIVEPSVDMIIGILGILKAGGAYLPIDPHYPEERKRYTMSDSGAEVLVTGPDDIPVGAGGLAPLSVPPLYLPLNPQLQTEPFKAPLNLRSSNLSYVIYTSGTTGRPKGCMITHRNLVRLMKNEKHPFLFDERDVWIMAHSYCFDFSVWEMYGALVNGGRVVVPARDEVRDVDRFLSLIVRYGVTVLNQTPQAFYHLAAAVKRLPSAETTLHQHLRYVVFGGDKLEPAYLKDWTSMCPLDRVPLINMYGITETTVHVTFYSLKQRDIDALHPVSPIGNALPETFIYILNRARQLQPVGVGGEIYVGGSGVARGYLNRPELTAEKFDPNFLDDQDDYDEKEKKKVIDKNPLTSLPFYPSTSLYRTGDLARRMADGNIQFLGRIDHQVKIRGFRIELGEIKNQLLTHPAVSEAVVTLREQDNGDRYLCAYIVHTEALDRKTLKKEELRNHLSRSLPDYMIPAYFIGIDRIPLTANGKLDQKSLPEPQTAAALEASTAPRNSIEKKLVEIWGNVLALPGSIGIDDDFFELGGHSLKATLLTARIHQVFDVQVPLADIFTSPTVRGLAEYIERADRDKYAFIEVAAPRDYYPLSSAQKGIFFHQNIKPDSTAYNSVRTGSFQGFLDKNKFQETVKKLIRRHESLRTSFQVINGQPVQVIHEDAEFEIDYYDTAAENTANRREKTEIRGGIHQFIRPFDLSKRPLLRVGLIKTSEITHILIQDMHHIITDGVSQEIFLRDFILFYEGKETDLPPLRIQYKDYVVWLTSKKVIEAKKRQKEYWLQVFEGEIPVLRMPCDFDRPAVEMFEGEMLTLQVQKELSEQLNRMAEEKETTLFMVLLAAYYVLLFKYSGQEDIVVGAPVTGRRHMDLQNIIGMFVNMLALRNRPTPEKTFNTLLMEVKEAVIDALDNQDFHFEELVTALRLQGGHGRNPLFDVVFAMQNVDIEKDDIIPSGDLYHLKASPYEFQHEVSQFDLLLGAFQGHDTITLDLRYATSLFKRSTAEKIVHRFLEILEQIVKNENIRLEEITISHELLSADSGIVDEEEHEFEFE
jgi:amino acid adenylation domain-containing protein